MGPVLTHNTHRKGPCACFQFMLVFVSRRGFAMYPWLTTHYGVWDDLKHPHVSTSRVCATKPALSCLKHWKGKTWATFKPSLSWAWHHAPAPCMHQFTPPDLWLCYVFALFAPHPAIQKLISQALPAAHIRNSIAISSRSHCCWDRGCYLCSSTANPSEASWVLPSSYLPSIFLSLWTQVSAWIQAFSISLLLVYFITHCSCLSVSLSPWNSPFPEVVLIFPKFQWLFYYISHILEQIFISFLILPGNKPLWKYM